MWPIAPTENISFPVRAINRRTLWDLTKSPPKTIAILYGHTGLVRAVAYRPDGKVFASGSTDTTIRRYPALFEDVLRCRKNMVPRELTPEEEESLLGK